MRRIIIFTSLCFGLLNIIAQNKLDNFIVSGLRLMHLWISCALGH